MSQNSYVNKSMDMLVTHTLILYMNGPNYTAQEKFIPLLVLFLKSAVSCVVGSEFDFLNVSAIS